MSRRLVRGRVSMRFPEARLSEGGVWMAWAHNPPLSLTDGRGIRKRARWLVKRCSMPGVGLEPGRDTANKQPLIRQTRNTRFLLGKYNRCASGVREKAGVVWMTVRSVYGLKEVSDCRHRC